MSIPDEIFLNPRTPVDVEFGKSIVATLSGTTGDHTSSYIKTDRTGEMTHYMKSDSIAEWPLIDYKCYPSTFLQSDQNIRNIRIREVNNTNDTFAKDVNNIDSYGSNLTSIDTLSNLPTLPTVNPLSVTLPAFMNYFELQFDLPTGRVYNITHFEFMMTMTGIPTIAHFLSVAEDGMTWNSITDPLEPIDSYDIDPINTRRLIIKPTTANRTNNIRLRVMHADPSAGAIAIKINHVFFAGEEV